MARYAWTLGVGAVILASVVTVHAQDPPARTITTVEVTGLTRASEVFVRNLVRVEAGDPLDNAVLDEAVARLLRTGRFMTARYTLADEAGGVRVTFELRERPIVNAIRFEGNTKFRQGQLKAQVEQPTGGPVDWLAVRDGRDAILAMYRDAGYGDVEVTYDPDVLTRTGELVFVIVEGSRVRIRQVLFEGNESFDERTLRRTVSTKKAFWIFRSGAFDEERAELDAIRLQTFYRDEGFLDAQAGYRRELSEDGEDLAVVFTIDEGVRYTIETIDFQGNTVFTSDELLGVIASEVGAVVNRPRVASDGRTIQQRYHELGYIYATVQPLRVFSATPGLVRITIDIREGEQYRVGRVVVRGNARTRDKVVRRALNLYPPDDLFDLTETREAEQRLVETRLFDSVRVYPVGDQPGVRDVVLDVREAARAGDFLFGLGVTSNAGLVGNVVLDLKNFDLSDWPRSWAELIKMRSFFGAGQHFRLELQPGTDVSRFRIDFTEPYWMDKPIRLDASAFLFDRGREAYDERRGGLTLSVGKRFDRGRLRGWSGELALRVEQASLRNLDLFTSRHIREDSDAAWLTSLQATLVRDRTDNRYLPTRGDRLRLSYEQCGVLGGDFSFGRFTAGYTWYKTMYTDVQDRKRVLALRAEGGAIIGNAPIYERFYAGGTGSMRGFQFRGVGERHGINDDNIGGDFLLLAGAEYTFPVVGENLRGLVFLDTGMVGSGGFRAAMGAGVRFTISVFGGPVPLEFALAAPVASDADDDTQVFSFLIGRIF